MRVNICGADYWRFYEASSFKPYKYTCILCPLKARETVRAFVLAPFLPNLNRIASG